MTRISSLSPYTARTAQVQSGASEGKRNWGVLGQKSYHHICYLEILQLKLNRKQTISEFKAIRVHTIKGVIVFLITH